MEEADVQHVNALLKEAEEHGIGVAFIPDGEGWEVRHVLDWPAVSDQYGEMLTGRLSFAYDLQTAVQAALRPLAELGESYDRYLASKAERGD